MSIFERTDFLPLNLMPFSRQDMYKRQMLKVEKAIELPIKAQKLEYAQLNGALYEFATHYYRLCNQPFPSYFKVNNSLPRDQVRIKTRQFSTPLDS